MEMPKFIMKMPSVWRVVLGVAIAVIVLPIALKLLAWGFAPVMDTVDGSRMNRASSPSFMGGQTASLGLAAPSSGGGMFDSFAFEKAYDAGVGLSVRNIAPTPPTAPGSPSGDDAEEYEVTDYNVRIGTRDLEGACGTLSALKAKEYVIFEQSNERDLGCSYTFKVKRDHVDEIVTAVKALDPRDFAESTRTIKRIVDDYTGELEILTKKRDAVERTLQQAIASYDEIATVATKAHDAETLARIIDRKLQALERLTQERIGIEQELDRMARAKADQLDRVDYVYFTIDVYEEKFTDGRDLADSWRAAVRRAIAEANRSLQAATVGLIALLFAIVRWAITLLILVVTAKVGWVAVKKIWKA